MAIVRNLENLTVVTQNVIPSLAEIPSNDLAMILAGGSPAVPVVEYTVSGKTITWNAGVAGYNIEVGEVVTVDYEYDDGLSGDGGTGGPYSPTDSQQNPVDVNYNLVVAEVDIVPNLIHYPVADSLEVQVNSVVKTENVDWTLTNNVVNWISGTTLNVNDIVNVAYRVPIS